MASRATYVNGHNVEPLHWSDFCEEQATIAASDFYIKFCNYLRDNPDLSIKDTASTFLRRFIDCLQGDFYQCIERGQPIREGYTSYPPAEHFPPHQDRGSPSSSTDVELQKTTKAKSFLRRLSIRKKTRKESKDGSYEDDHKSKSKQRTNIKKEGIVFRLLENGSAHKWEKCRLVLVNNPSGYLLEFYSPPKVSRPELEGLVA